MKLYCGGLTMFAVLFKHIHASCMTLKFFKMAETFLRSNPSFIKKKKV